MYKTPTKNLFLLPSSLATYLLIIPLITNVTNKFIDTGEITKKEVVTLLTTITTVVLQQLMRYAESEGEIYTPHGCPGLDKIKEKQDNEPNNSDDDDNFTITT